jgi:phosphoribosylglycinamide formyltransferase-1
VSALVAAREAVNLIAPLANERFELTSVHFAIDALDLLFDVRASRFNVTPERILSWIDAEFGGTLSSDARAGGIWIAEDAKGPLAFAAYDARGLRFPWLERWKSEDDVGIFGPFGVAERARGGEVGRTLLAAALGALRERGYARALIPAVEGERLISYFEREANAAVAERFSLDVWPRRFRTTVLASGNGSNFQAVLDGVASGELPLDVRALVVNKEKAYARERAAAAGVRTESVVWQRKSESRDAYDRRVIAAVAQSDPELVLLLGWMHILPEAFVARFSETLNIHPGFLPLDPALDAVTMPGGVSIPAFRGAHAIDDALAADAPWVGASVHRVGLAVDRGEVLARAPLRRLDGETSAELMERVHAAEHRVLRAAIRRWAYERETLGFVNTPFTNS